MFRLSRFGGGSGGLLAPVFCQVIDAGRFNDLRAQCRAGVGFTIRIELGNNIESMDVKYFQRKVDDEMRAKSAVYGTCVNGKVTDRFGNQVDKIHAYGKYIVCGQMSHGYLKNDMKFGIRATGYNGAKMRSGVKWAGEE